MSPLSKAGHKWESKYIRKESKNQLFPLPSLWQVSFSFHLSHALKPHQRKVLITPALGNRTSPRGADSLSLFVFDFTPRTGTRLLFTPGTKRNRKDIILHIAWQGLSLLPPARASALNLLLRLWFLEKFSGVCSVQLRSCAALVPSL